jgi:hypothetical protein
MLMTVLVPRSMRVRVRMRVRMVTTADKPITGILPMRMVMSMVCCVRMHPHNVHPTMLLFTKHLPTRPIQLFNFYNGHDT